MPNLKLDIIYYKTSSDFELEFNLSGCCRMRIFKDKVETPKELISALARDVSRSRIILVVTDLCGENSGFETLSKAIGLPLISPDKAEFGIKTCDPVQMPKGAVPLITKSGIYGGCIIESGPQSIIIVSSVRSLRHEIMKAYVHNYVFDVGQIVAYNERMGKNESTEIAHNLIPPTVEKEAEPREEPVVEEQLETTEAESVTEPADNTEESAAEALEDVAAETSEEIADATPSDSDNSEELAVEGDAEAIPEEKPVLEEEPIPEEAEPLVDLEDISSGEEEDEDSEEEEYPRLKPPKRGSNIALLIIVILLLAALGFLAYFLFYLPLTGGEITFFSDGDIPITDVLKEWLTD